MSNEVEDKEVIGLRSLPRKQVVITLAGVLLAMFLSSLDQTIVSTAMPRIVADLGGLNHYAWLTTSYLVASTVVLPIVGKLTDMYGRKHFYTAGIAIFIIGSFLSGLSQSMLQIIIFRGFQGIGGGIMLANAFTVIGDLFPPSERGKFQGLASGVFGVSAVIGPLLGGYITDAFSWHWIFYINIPLGILNIILFVFFFPNYRINNIRHKIDYAGIAAIICAVIPLLLALSWGGSEYPWLSFPIISLFVVSALSLILLPIIERGSKEPILPFRIFSIPVIAVSIPIIFLIGVGMFGGIIFIPLYFQGVLGLSAAASGSFLTPMILGQVGGSFVSGIILSRAGGHYRLQGAIGLGIMVIGLFFVTRWTPETSFVSALISIVFMGFGLGMTMPLYTIAIQNAVPYNLLGVSTSLVPFFRSMGGAVGLAVLGSIMTNRFASEFIFRLPETLKDRIAPDIVSSMANNLQALLSADPQTQLQLLSNQLGLQDAAVTSQVLTFLRQALNSSLTEVFSIIFFITILVFIINWFLKEIPLRTQHVLSDQSADEESTE
jgi:EmrB/QacA subfamily drug resistance transporter